MNRPSQHHARGVADWWASCPLTNKVRKWLAHEAGVPVSRVPRARRYQSREERASFRRAAWEASDEAVDAYHDAIEEAVQADRAARAREPHGGAPFVPCPRCHGLGYLTEDPLPDCQAFGGYEERECPACEGTGVWDPDEP